MFGQSAINTLIAASAYILAGVSFYLTYSVARFYHFTQGAFFVLGAYASYSLSASVGLPIVAAILITIPLFGSLAVALDWLVYRRIRRGGSSTVIPLLASLGLYTAIQNIVSMTYGDSALTFPNSGNWSVFSVAGGRITLAQVAQMGLAVAVIPTSWLLMNRTLSGKKMRAVGRNRDLARALGLQVDKLIGLSFAAGYAMAALAGVAAAANVDLTPTMGMRPMMMGMVAMIIGATSFWGTIGGAVLLAVTQQIAIIWVPTQWQDTIAFAVLALVLIARPKGLFAATIESK